MLIRCEGYSCSSWGRTVHSFAEKKKNLSLFPAEFLQDGRYCFQSHSFWWGAYPPPPADSIWRMFMLLVRGEPFTFYCGGGGLKNCWSKVTAPKSKDSFIIFFNEKNDNSTQLFLYEWRRLAQQTCCYWEGTAQCTQSRQRRGIYLQKWDEFRLCECFFFQMERFSWYIHWAR